MSDQNQWPKPGEQSDGAAPGRIRSRTRFRCRAERVRPGHPASRVSSSTASRRPNPYAQQQPGQQQPGQQYGQPQQYGQQAPNPYAQQHTSSTRRNAAAVRAAVRPVRQAAVRAAAVEPVRAAAVRSTARPGAVQTPTPATGLPALRAATQDEPAGDPVDRVRPGAIPLFFIAILLGPRRRDPGPRGPRQDPGTPVSRARSRAHRHHRRWVMTGLWLLWIIFVVIAIGQSGSYSDYGNDFRIGYRRVHRLTRPVSSATSRPVRTTPGAAGTAGRLVSRSHRGRRCGRPSRRVSTSVIRRAPPATAGACGTGRGRRPPRAS